MGALGESSSSLVRQRDFMSNGTEPDIRRRELMPIEPVFRHRMLMIHCDDR